MEAEAALIASSCRQISEELLNLSEVPSFVVGIESTLFVVSSAHLLKKNSDREVRDIGSMLRHKSELRWRAARPRQSSVHDARRVADLFDNDLDAVAVELDAAIRAVAGKA